MLLAVDHGAVAAARRPGEALDALAVAHRGARNRAEREGGHGRGSGAERPVGEAPVVVGSDEEHDQDLLAARAARLAGCGWNGTRFAHNRSACQ